MTLGYFWKDGEFLPRLDPEGNPNGEKQRQNLEALRRFLKEFDPAEKGGLESGDHVRDGRRLVNRLFTLFMARPTMVEIESFGDYLFSDDVLTGNCQEVAGRLTEREIRNLYILRRLCILNGVRKDIIRESAWIEGSIVRCGMCRSIGKKLLFGQDMDRHYIKKSLRHIRWYKYLVYVRKQLKAWKRDTVGDDSFGG